MIPTPDQEREIREFLKPRDGTRSYFEIWVVNVLKGLLAALDACRADKEKWMRAERDLSDAYVRLRMRIPGAFDTPFGPSGEQVWDTTERALKALLSELARLREVKDLALARFHQIEVEVRENPNAHNTLLNIMDEAREEIREALLEKSNG